VSLPQRRQPSTCSSDTGRLVRAAQSGDRAAFGQLYMQYSGMIHAMAVVRVPFDEAGDVVQEVFLRALRQLKALRDPDAFGSWLAAIARNAIRDLPSRPRPTSEVDETIGSRETQHDEMEARAALESIRGLPTAYRDTLMMRLVQGMSGPEIAERTGLTPASVRVNLHRGMKQLRRRLGAAASKEVA
jgi:RNA polymerase sigma-70 factor, ECF subfamily